MLPHWARIRVPVYYFQGSNDDLIYTSNARFAQQQLVNTQSLKIHMLPGLGHLIAFKARPVIQPAILQMLDEAQRYYASRTGSDSPTGGVRRD